MQIPIRNMVAQNKITMEIEVWKNKEKWKTYSMKFLLTSHTELLLNCEKTQLCMGHIVILSFLLFLWSVSKYKTCNWHELSYIYFLTCLEHFFLSFFLFFLSIFLLFSGLRFMCLYRFDKVDMALLTVQDNPSTNNTFF